MFDGLDELLLLEDEADVATVLCRKFGVVIDHCIGVLAKSLLSIFIDVEEPFGQELEAECLDHLLQLLAIEHMYRQRAGAFVGQLVELLLADLGFGKQIVL